MTANKSNRLKIDKSSLKNELENHTEDFVLDKLEEVLNNDEQFNDICTCHNCLLDMASYTLNRIPAKYISSPQGSLHAKLIEFEQQVNVDIISVLTRAIKIISKNPRHNE
ncbi:late competence development ComFB family protein [Halanaerobiaceae bacterium Z-7014]|uniref:Late competence development ComFB family protein n=1 Tax=Halonatronomonas betaini TaxID=2778430 RepID=A0A931ATI8_9FIRM|nr:late competence development ComFB family protein [Halonatronomonas betaini]MBF8438182.1 late competence development ComFB family protein [Halonatronomonas betaini]